MIKTILAATVILTTSSVAGIWPLWHQGNKLLGRLHSAAALAVKEQKSQGWDFWTIEIDNLAAELKEEKIRLAQQAEQLELRSARVAAEQQELDKLRADLEAMRSEIGAKIIEIKADEAKNLRALSSAYANLTPRAAVAIIRELDDLTAVKILSMMKADSIGPIFEEMSKTASPDGTLAGRAAMLSDKLRLMKKGVTDSKQS